MAPEVVNDTIDVTSFSAFKSADMYSTSLVFWELCRQVFFLYIYRYVLYYNYASGSQILLVHVSLKFKNVSHASHEYYKIK